MTVGRIPSVEGGIQPTLLTTKGDIIVATGNATLVRQGVGANGTVLTANSAQADGVEWATPSAPAFVGCMLRKSTDQNISTSVYTAITFDTEVLDTDGFHSNVTNNERITIPTGKSGKYLITASILYAPNASNSRRNLVTLNGAVSVGTTVCDQRGGGFSGASSEVNFVGFYALTAGDYIQLNAFQDSGSTLAAGGFSTAFSYFGVQYLGA